MRNTERSYMKLPVEKRWPVSLNNMNTALDVYKRQGICYDLRFPELARYEALAGAQIMIYPSAWVKGEGKFMQWETLLRARAIENEMYVLGCCHYRDVYKRQVFTVFTASFENTFSFNICFLFCFSRIRYGFIMFPSFENAV